MRKDQTVELQGKTHPLYSGVLAKAHERGLAGIEVEMLQAPTEENGQTAICRATVTMKDGSRWVEIGDASPKNVRGAMATALIRFAATRAKGRALRDAVNIGEALREELSDEEEDYAPRAVAAPRPQPETRKAPPPAEEEPVTGDGGALDRARKAYFSACRESGLDAMCEEIDAGTGYLKALQRSLFSDFAEREIATRADATAEDFATARRNLLRLKPDARRALVQGHYDALVAPPLAGMDAEKAAALQAQSANRAAQLAGH